MRKKASAEISMLEAFEKDEPPKPTFTCPKIDALVGQFEELRDCNNDLRFWGEHWKDACIEMQLEIDNLKAQLSSIKDILE